MTHTAHMAAAKAAKNDDFLTPYILVASEIGQHYQCQPEHFKNKTIYCPCDCDWSAFTNYFLNNFEQLQLKKLICTGYHQGSRGEFVIKTADSLTIGRLAGDGDYNSQECCAYRDSADVIITNPPFSKMRDFWTWLHGKSYLMIAPLNAIKYKSIFPAVMTGRLRAGYNWDFDIGPAGACCFVTDLPVKPADWVPSGSYIPATMPAYDTIDAIYIKYTRDIPAGYTGKMAVPITWLKYYDPTKHILHGIINHGQDHQWDLAKPILRGKETFARLIMSYI